MTELIRPLFAPDVLVAEADPRRVSPSVLSEREAAQVERAVAKRRREFAAGRLLARRLMRRLGVEEELDLLNGEDRAPIWPSGVVGTISHTRTRAAVALARSGDVVSLGCDLELDEPLAENLLRRICDDEERAWIAAAPATHRGRLAMLVFSAKEAAYKAQYPLTGRVLDFDAFHVRFDGGEEGGDFSAQVRRELGPWPIGHRLAGRWRRGDGLIATAVTVREADLPAASVDVAE